MKTNYKTTFILSFLLICMFSFSQISTCFGQITVQLTQTDEQASDAQKCFNIELANTSENNVALAGQNYRLYYNSGQAVFNANSLTSFLSDSYTSIKIVQNFTNQNASGYGSLPYESQLGFLNLALDYKLETGNALQIGTGQTEQIAQFCFDKVTGDEQPIQIDWADKNTGGYATADVEISQKVPGKLIPVTITGRHVIQNENSQLLVEDKNRMAISLTNAKIPVGLAVQNNNVESANFQVDLENQILSNQAGNYCIVSYVPTEKVSLINKKDIITKNDDGTYHLALSYFNKLSDATIISNRFTNQGISNNKIYKIAKNVSGLSTVAQVSKL